jgi:hypothetical protein
MTLLFGRYDAPSLERLFQESGVLGALRAKGFAGFEVEVSDAGLALPHVLLRARKDGRRHLLLDACLRRVSVSPAIEPAGAEGNAASLDLLLVQWVREEDPTADFSPERPPLPLQNHPGLGVLRRAFRVAVRLAGDLGADGIASRPKFYHDALIFERSRLFLFLDGGEQGRFEALMRDLEALPLREATLAVAGWCVRDEGERVLRWDPGYLVFPLSPRLTSYLHTPAYAAAVLAARKASRFRVDGDALARVCAELDADAAG